MTARILPMKPKLITEQHWIQTASGEAFDLVEQNPSQVSVSDISASLAKLCRFNGHTRLFYSVAQHSVLVADILERHGAEAQLYGLLHDAHEAYIGDQTRPVKRLFKGFDIYDARSDLEAVLQRTVHVALGLKHPVPDAIAKAVEDADERALATELRDVMEEPRRDWKLKAQPWHKPIRAWSWTLADEKFLDKFHTLAAMVGIRNLAS